MDYFSLHIHYIIILITSQSHLLNKLFKIDCIKKKNMVSLIHKVEKEGDPLMKKISKKCVNSMLTRGGLVNNTLYIIKAIKDYGVTSFNTSDFS